MKIYTVYLLKQLMQYCLLVCLILTAIVWVIHTSNLMQLIINKGVHILDFLKLALYMIPYLNFTILPLGTLAASILVMHRFYINRELLALQSIGMSHFKIGIPFFLFGLIIMVLAYFSSFFIMPKSYNKFKELYFFLQHHYISSILIEESFSTQIPGVTIYVGKKIKDNAFSDILINDSRNSKYSITISAKYGEFQYHQNNIYIIAKEGTNHQKNNINNTLSIISFQSYAMQIDINDEKIQKTTEPSEYLIQELFYKRNNQTNYNLMIAHAHQRISWPYFCFLFPLISVALSLSGNYNRELYWQKATKIILVSITLIISAIFIHNIHLKYSGASFFVYFNIIVPTVTSFYTLFIQSSCCRKSI